MYFLKMLAQRLRVANHSIIVHLLREFGPFVRLKRHIFAVPEGCSGGSLSEAYLQE